MYPQKYKECFVVAKQSQIFQVHLKIRNVSKAELENETELLMIHYVQTIITMWCLHLIDGFSYILEI